MIRKIESGDIENRKRGKFLRYSILHTQKNLNSNGPKYFKKSWLSKKKLMSFMDRHFQKILKIYKKKIP